MNDDSRRNDSIHLLTSSGSLERSLLFCIFVDAMEGTLPLTGLYALSFSDPKTSMNKHDISLPHFSATIGEISLYESIHRWGRGILIGGTIASVVAANTLALLHWLRRKRTKSYRYATKSLTALEIGSGVELHIRFDATA